MMEHMIDPLDNAAGLAAFINTVETGSFSAAARPGRHDPLLGVQERGPAGAPAGRGAVRALDPHPEPDPGGRRPISRRITPLLRALSEAQDVVQTAAAAEGRLRVSLPTDLGRLLMDPLTRDFLKRHPRIHLELDMTDRHVDLIREGYDLVLRAGQVDDTELVARPLGAAPLVLVAAPTTWIATAVRAPWRRWRRRGMSATGWAGGPSRSPSPTGRPCRRTGCWTATPASG